jgi:hypothetical protein
MLTSSIIEHYTDNASRYRLPYARDTLNDTYSTDKPNDTDSTDTPNDTASTPQAQYFCCEYILYEVLQLTYIKFFISVVLSIFTNSYAAF